MELKTKATASNWWVSEWNAPLRLGDGRQRAWAALPQNLYTRIRVYLFIYFCVFQTSNEIWLLSHGFSLFKMLHKLQWAVTDNDDEDDSGAERETPHTHRGCCCFVCISFDRNGTDRKGARSIQRTERISVAEFWLKPLNWNDSLLLARPTKKKRKVLLETRIEKNGDNIYESEWEEG